MTISKLRLCVFVIWFGALVLFAMMFFASPLCGRYQSFTAALKDFSKIATLYTPILTGFGVFWFRPGSSHASGRLRKYAKEIVLGCSVLFNILVLVALVFILFVVEYDAEAIGVGVSPSPDDLITYTLGSAMVFSPFVTIAIVRILGVESL